MENEYIFLCHRMGHYHAKMMIAAFEDNEELMQHYSSKAEECRLKLFGTKASYLKEDKQNA